MKDGDEQELNPMEDPPKENKESQALVADGDSKRPKSEVGTNEKLFKMGKYGDTSIKKAHEGEQLSFPGMEPPKPPTTPPNLKGDENHLVPSTRTRKQKIADMAKKIIEGLKQKRGESSVENSLLKVVSGGMSEDDWDELNRMREDPASFPEETRSNIDDRLERESGGTQSEDPDYGANVADAPPGFAEVGSNAPDALGQRDKRKNVLHYGEEVGEPDIYENAIKKALLKLMKADSSLPSERKSRTSHEMLSEFPVRTFDDKYDPSIRVYRRRMDALVRPDPTQPPIAGEEEQQDWDEAGSSERGRGGKPSGIYGVRPNNPGLGRRRTDENASGQPNYRKIPIGKTDMEKGGTFWGGSRKQDVPQSLPKTKPSWGRKENEAAKQAGVERSIARLRTPRNWYSSDQGMGNIGDTRGQRKKSIEKAPVEGQGTSAQSEGFDLSKPLPKAPVTGPDHPEGPGVPLREGFTELEYETMEESDPRSGRKDYPQDPAAKPTDTSLMRSERARQKGDVEQSLLKLMKEGEIIPSKVGLPKKNVTEDLEKVVLPQTMGQKPGVMNPVAKRTAPLAAQSSLPTAAEGEAGVSQDVDVGRMLQYGAYQQAGGVADKLLGIKQPGDETGTLPGAVAGGVKAGMGAAKKIGSLFGGGKKQPETLKSSSGMPPSNQNTQQNYYSRDIK